MNYLSNIEPKPRHPGVYLGYSRGVWRIRREGKRWLAVKVGGPGIFYARTLTEASVILERMEAEAA